MRETRAGLRLTHDSRASSGALLGVAQRDSGASEPVGGRLVANAVSYGPTAPPTRASTCSRSRGRSGHRARLAPYLLLVWSTLAALQLMANARWSHSVSTRRAL